MLEGKFARSGHPGLAAALVAVVGLSGSGCKEITETFVEKGVKAAKDTTKGIEEGIDKGRKGGESGDGAFIVSRPEELTGKATITLREVRPAPDDPKRSEIEFAIENTTDRPLRVTHLEALALDGEGFAKRPSTPIGELTVPAKSKEKLVIGFGAEASSLAKARLWGVDYELGGARAAK